MGQITTRTKMRKTFRSIIEDEEKEDKIFITSDGEEFFTMASAKKYQNKYDRVENFKQHFSISKGNLKKGEISLACEVANIKDTSRIRDCFWIKFKTAEEVTFMAKFCKQHYTLPGLDAQSIAVKFAIDEWFFIVIATSKTTFYHGKQNIANILSTCDLTHITDRIEALKSLIPNFSEIDKPVKERIKEDENNQFSLLDIR